jgi:putative transposase
MPGTYTKLLYHIIFSTKNRLPLITAAVQDDFYRYIAGIVVGEGSTLFEIGGMPDHIHLLVQVKPTMALSDFMRQLKANSSKWLNERIQTAHKFAWQDGYAAFTVSPSQASRVRAYIQD